jgi:serine/threonine protein kinase
MLAPIEPGTIIHNRYIIQKVLGQGGFGRTYLAFDNERFGHSCALKEFVSSWAAEEVAVKSRELFEREAKALYQLNHPQIPKFLAWFANKDRLFIVQEYINGKTYSQLLRERLYEQKQPFSEADVIQWLKDFLPVLDYLHGLKTIHRDIALDNVMFSFDISKPVLIDFGFVKEKVSQIWSVGTVLGKKGYAPLEQIRMGQSYPSSDLYAVGVCAIVMLTGKMPEALMDQSLEWQWRSYVNISECLTNVLDKMLAEKPNQRFQSAKEILAELQPQPVLQQAGINLPLKKFQINIDQAKKERDVAEILESDDFKLLEQQANKLRQTDDHTPLSQVRAHLIHVQTDKQIDLPQNLSVIYIGKPNSRIPPNVDVSTFADSRTVSRIHAQIRVEGDAFYIEDLGSSNGTYINNVRLLPGKEHRLRSGERISLGRVKLVTFLFQLS